MKNFIILLSSVFIFISCKKTIDSKTYTIKGKFVKCTNGVETPMLINEPIDLFQKNNGSNNNSKVLANTNTDVNGNFIFTYTTKNIVDRLIIRASSGFGFADYMKDIPLENLENLKVYTPPLFNLVVSLNVIKAYTSNDTLSILKPDSNLIKKIVGPFVSGRVFNCKNVGIPNTYNYISNDLILQCGLNKFINLNKEYKVENNKLCGDTVYVNIDVR